MLAHAMYERDLERERAILENALKVREHDFAAAYLAICDLHSLVMHIWLFATCIHSSKPIPGLPTLELFRPWKEF
jgi:hypothetical protein